MNRYQTWQQKARGMTTMVALLMVAMTLAACALQPIAATQPVSAEQQNKETDTITTPEQGDPKTTASLIIRHEVNDFDTWKKTYNGGTEFIKGLGIIADSVHRDLDNPNIVTVYHQFAEVATGKAFTVALKGDDFKAMAERPDCMSAPKRLAITSPIFQQIAGCRPGAGDCQGTVGGVGAVGTVSVQPGWQTGVNQ